jgi:hypothetical protein
MQIRVISYLLYLALFIISCSPAVKLPVSNPVQQMAVDMLTLSSDEMEGRETGTEGERKAAEFIQGRYMEIGLSPLGTDGYLQSFSRKRNQDPHQSSSPSRDSVIYGNNIIGFLDNGSKNTVIIGAHYDHLGFGAEGSLYKGEKQIHNGADDNASGITGLLLLAENLKKTKKLKNNYIFVAFSGEEKGLLGSNYFANNPTIGKQEMNYMINMDMIGRLNPERSLVIGGIGTSPLFDQVISQVKSPKFQLKKELSGAGPSDHMSFYLAGIPVLSFFTGQHEDYHKPTDDAHLINYSGMKDVASLIYQIIISLDKSEKLPFTKTQDSAPQNRSFAVSLGIMPDYLFDGKGVKVDGLREGKPGQKAGIQKGDIIIMMGSIDITDMKSYMNSLGTFKPGDKIDVRIIRNQQEITLPVTL